MEEDYCAEFETCKIDDCAGNGGCFARTCFTSNKSPKPEQVTVSKVGELLDTQITIDGKKIALYAACSDLVQMDQALTDFGDVWKGNDFSKFNMDWQDKVEYLIKIARTICGEPIKKSDYTCNKCGEVKTCSCDWDLYNTSGECLAWK